MAMDYDIMQDLAPDPYAFFSTAAGPDTSDLVGPPGAILDVYTDGSSIAASETGIANTVGAGGGLPSFWKRRDIRYLIVLAIGLWMLNRHMKS